MGVEVGAGSEEQIDKGGLGGFGAELFGRGGWVGGMIRGGVVVLAVVRFRRRGCLYRQLRPYQYGWPGPVIENLRVRLMVMAQICA